MLRRVDHLGRLVLPAEYRRELNFGFNQMVEVTLSGRAMQVRRAQPCCCICGHQQNLSELDPYTFLCSRCIITVMERFHTPLFPDAPEAPKED